MKYDPASGPDLEKWLAFEEAQRLDLVSAYHRRMRGKVPNAHLHTAVPVIVESHLAEGFDIAKDAYGPRSRFKASTRG